MPPPQPPRAGMLRIQYARIDFYQFLGKSQGLRKKYREVQWLKHARKVKIAPRLHDQIVGGGCVFWGGYENAIQGVLEHFLGFEDGCNDWN